MRGLLPVIRSPPLRLLSGGSRFHHGHNLCLVYHILLGGVWAQTFGPSARLGLRLPRGSPLPATTAAPSNIGIAVVGGSAPMVIVVIVVLTGGGVEVAAVGAVGGVGIAIVGRQLMVMPTPVAVV